MGVAEDSLDPKQFRSRGIVESACGAKLERHSTYNKLGAPAEDAALTSEAFLPDPAVRSPRSSQRLLGRKRVRFPPILREPDHASLAVLPRARGFRRMGQEECGAWRGFLFLDPSADVHLGAGALRACATACCLLRRRHQVS